MLDAESAGCSCAIKVRRSGGWGLRICELKGVPAVHAAVNSAQSCGVFDPCDLHVRINKSGKTSIVGGLTRPACLASGPCHGCLIQTAATMDRTAFSP